MSRILVLNATGKVSSNLIERLVADGHAVTAASRNPSEPSTDAIRRVHFDYEDPSTFEAALADVDRLFWLGPPAIVDSASYCKAFFDVALQQVDKVVLMTAQGVDVDDSIPLRQLELRVADSGVNWTVIRPSWFMDNFHTFWVEPMRGDGVIPVPAGEAASAFIDAGDIAASAAAALTDDSTNGQAYVLTGPESLTYAEAAEVLSAAAGRTIRYLPIDDETFVAAMVGVGLPADYAGFLDALFQAVRAGAAAQTTDGVERLTGRAPRTLADYAAEHADAWQG
jgi:uncharacterized protein YbjT (DUF2867 family)